MFRFLHVTVAYATTSADPKVLEPIVEQLCRDWVRYTATTWVLWTEKSAITVAEMIKTKLHVDDLLLVHPVDPKEPPQGWLQEWVWEWFRRSRDPQTGRVDFPVTPPADPTPLPDWIREALESFESPKGLPGS